MLAKGLPTLLPKGEAMYGSCLVCGLTTYSRDWTQPLLPALMVCERQASVTDLGWVNACSLLGAACNRAVLMVARPAQLAQGVHIERCLHSSRLPGIFAGARAAHLRYWGAQRCAAHSCKRCSANIRGTQGKSVRDTATRGAQRRAARCTLPQAATAAAHQEHWGLEQAAGHLRWGVNCPPSQPVGSGFGI